MKIYFTASITGRREFKKNYDAIIKEIENLGYTVETSLYYDVSGDKRKEEPKEKRTAIHNKIMRAIKSSNIIIAEASYSSTNVGYEITKALEREKPVLVLHVSGRVPVLLLGVNTGRLKIAEYSLDKLPEILQSHLEDLGDTVDTRFNFFISRKLSSYLDWIAKNRRIPRAVYLRQLITREMRKHRDFLEGS